MKNKKIFTYIMSSLLALSVTGCKDFLETGPSTSISTESIFTDVNGAQLALNGTYAYIRARNTNVETGSIIQFDFGFDIAANDLIVRNSMGQLQNYYSHNYAETRSDNALTAAVWSYFYGVINNANLIINGVDNAAGDAQQKAYIKGQALAIRGWAYFYLIRFYQQTYSLAKNMPGVPYYDQGGTTDGKPRESVSFIYEHIVSDLTSAIDLLNGYEREYKDQVNRQVAQAFLAEVYLTMEDWSNAAAMANAARTNFPLMNKTQFQSGFNDWALGEWMWAIQQTSTQNVGDSSPFTLWANQTRGTRWTFDFLCVNDTFIDLFEENDVRNQFWFREDLGLWTSDKYRDAADYYGDIVLMRASEMYLIEAEALARQGQDQAAKEVLWQVQDIRQASRSASTGTALIDDILVERRKELYAEGMAWFDLIRNQRPVQRTGDHPIKTQIPARSWLFILQIPVSEFNSNRALTTADQNPYDGIYQP